MTPTMVFPLLVALLELGAGIVYALHGNYPLAVAWTAYAVGCVGLAIAGR